MLKNSLKINNYLSNQETNISGIKWIVYQARKFGIWSLFILIRFEIDWIVRAWLNITGRVSYDGITNFNKAYLHVQFQGHFNGTITGTLGLTDTWWPAGFNNIFLPFHIEIKCSNPTTGGSTGVALSWRVLSSLKVFCMGKTV